MSSPGRGIAGSPSTGFADVFGTVGPWVVMLGAVCACGPGLASAPGPRVGTGGGAAQSTRPPPIAERARAPEQDPCSPIPADPNAVDLFGRPVHHPRLRIRAVPDDRGENALHPATIAQLLTEQSGGIARCYADALGSDPSLSGCLEVVLSIDARGAVREAEIESGSQLGGPTFRTCIADSIRRTEYPPGSDASTARLTLRFDLP